MNANQPLTPDDPQLTAFALGELDGAQRDAVAAAVAADAVLAQAVEQIRADAQILEAALLAAEAEQAQQQQQPEPSQLSAALQAQIFRRLEQEHGAVDVANLDESEATVAATATATTATAAGVGSGTSVAAGTTEHHTVSAPVAFGRTANWNGFALPLAAGFAVLLCAWGIWWSGSPRNPMDGVAATYAFSDSSDLAQLGESESAAFAQRSNALMAARPWAYLPDGRAVSSSAMGQTPPWQWDDGKAPAGTSYFLAADFATKSLPESSFEAQPYAASPLAARVSAEPPVPSGFASVASLPAAAVAGAVAPAAPASVESLAAKQASSPAAIAPAAVLAEAEALVRPLAVDSDPLLADSSENATTTVAATATTAADSGADLGAAQQFAARATLPYSLPDSLADGLPPVTDEQTLLPESSAGIPSVVVSAPGVAPSISSSITPRLFAPAARQPITGGLVADSAASRSARAAAREARQASIEQLEAAAFTNVPLQLVQSGAEPAAVAATAVAEQANQASQSAALPASSAVGSAAVQHSAAGSAGSRQSSADARESASTVAAAAGGSSAPVRTLDLGNRYVQVLLWVESGHLPELARSEVSAIVRAAAVCYGFVSESNVGRQGQGLSDAQLEALEKQSALLRAVRGYLLLLSERPADARLKLAAIAEQLQELKRTVDNPGIDDLLAMIAATRALLP